MLAAAAALAFAGCGGDDERVRRDARRHREHATERRPKPPTEARPRRPAAASKLAIAADPGGAKKFTETELTATAGQVTVEFANDSQLPHAVEIEGNGVEEDDRDRHRCRTRRR